MINWEKNMNEREKLIQYATEYCRDNNSIEDIIYGYLTKYNKDFSARRLHNIINTLNDKFMADKITHLENAKFVAKERAGYLKRYLEGKMYSTREIAESYVDVQIENAEAIINECDRGD